MDLKIKIGRTTYDNPVWVASGTFGSGKEFEDFLELKKVGAIVAKTVTLNAREGNPPPRTVETPSGMLNAIGLENKGAAELVANTYPFLKRTGTKIVISISGANKKEFVECADIVAEKNFPHAVELNLSCPNVEHGGTKHRLIAQDAAATERLVKAVRRKIKCDLIAKLTPNVTDITSIAMAAEAGGADAVALVNTYMGMAVDAETRKPVLGNIAGGLSGPAIKPMALKAVRDAYLAVKIPVIGIGGIMKGTDVVEFMLCGATAVQVGTVNLVDPAGQGRILREFETYLKRHRVKKAKDLIGKLKG
ncbi:MAG: dihydroorotate dehydrogenase [Candidatus Tantalella remota]|nr:dihydroorotate dehydrogenase [Candidatus Tantalella remota]